MRLALISDTHDHFEHLESVVAYLQASGIEVVLHAGDLTSPHTLEMLRDFNLWIAQGNMDRAEALIETATDLFGAGRFAPFHDLLFDDHPIALLHGHDRQMLQGVSYAQHYDYVVCGHTHVPEDQQIQGTRRLNPGAVGNPPWRSSTFAILDLDSGELTTLSI
ncbi:MAG: metallophosphoesterase family protein [Anaerolineae bacterium]